jgi:hypothetical protein
MNIKNEYLNKNEQVNSIHLFYFIVFAFTYMCIHYLGHLSLPTPPCLLPTNGERRLLTIAQEGKKRHGRQPL